LNFAAFDILIEVQLIENMPFCIHRYFSFQNIGQLYELQQYIFFSIAIRLFSFW